MENIFEINIIPSNDSERVAALNRYHLINTVPEQILDQIVQLTADTFDTPMALISLVDINHVFFKASVGAPGLDSMPRGRSLCSIAVLNTEPLIIHYAEKERCLLSIPIVAAEFGFKFYASAPLITPDGFAIGALCITDTRAREFTPEHTESLKGLAGMIMQEIEKKSTKLETPTY